MTTLFSPTMLPNPYPVYQQFRAAEPVYWEESQATWMLFRYDDIVAALHDPRLAAERVISLATLKEKGLEEIAPVFQTLANMMLFADPPRHTRLRGLVSKAFTPRAVEAMRPHIQHIVDDLLDAVQDTGRMDVIRDLAYPLPVTVIAEMLGVPAADREQFKRWSDDLALIFGNVRSTEEESRYVMRSLGEFTSYFREAIARVRAHPQDDLLSALALAEEAGDRLTTEELFANAILLLTAGHETTTNLLGNGTLALLRHPDQLQFLQDEPARIGNAVEELLRYDSPVQFTGRLAKEDLEIGGKLIARGQQILLLLGAANRDPAQFPEPDRLDLARPTPRHVAFGHGPHFCLGAPLARLEGQIAFNTLLRRMPDLRLAEAKPMYRANFNLRGVQALPVEF